MGNLLVHSDLLLDFQPCYPAPMMNQMTCSAGCWTWALAVCIIWWLVASALLYVTWNRVVVAVTTARSAQIWHALLVVFTLGVLCAPNYMAHKMRDGCHSKCSGLRGDKAPDAKGDQPAAKPDSDY